MFIKNTAAGLIYLATTASKFQAITTIVFVVYFITMLKLNAVDKKYKGSWVLYFKSIFNYFFKK